MTDDSPTRERLHVIIESKKQKTRTLIPIDQIKMVEEDRGRVQITMIGGGHAAVEAPSCGLFDLIARLMGRTDATEDEAR